MLAIVSIFLTVLCLLLPLFTQWLLWLFLVLFVAFNVPSFVSLYLCPSLPLFLFFLKKAQQVGMFFSGKVEQYYDDKCVFEQIACSWLYDIARTKKKWLRNIMYNLLMFLKFIFYHTVLMHMYIYTNGIYVSKILIMVLRKCVFFL